MFRDPFSGFPDAGQSPAAGSEKRSREELSSQLLYQFQISVFLILWPGMRIEKMFHRRAVTVVVHRKRSAKVKSHNTDNRFPVNQNPVVADVYIKIAGIRKLHKFMHLCEAGQFDFFPDFSAGIQYFPPLRL